MIVQMGRIVCFLSAVALLGACGDEKDFGNPTLPDSGMFPDSSPSDGGVDGSMDGSVTDAQDATPPKITVISPTPGEVLRGSIEVTVSVVDDSAPITLTATISNLEIDMVPVPGSAGDFKGTVDTITLAGLVAPTIIVRATDNGGLQSEVGVQIVLDNEAPIASLDAPSVRLKRDGETGVECSRDFDPLGTDTPNDGEVVPQLFELRGRVHDLSNTGTVNSVLFVPRAGTDRVELYVLDDTAKPLVVDTDGDGECDDINPDIVPAISPQTSNEAAVISLAPIEPAGAAFFASDTFGGFNAACVAGSETDPPAPLCLGETNTTIIHDLDGSPEIFGIPPVNEFNCLGFAFDARASNITDGFACAALLVTDTLGNRRVSEPLRICVDSDLSGDDCNGSTVGQIVGAGNRPNCTGTVTGGTVNNTACTPKRFFSGVANEFELIQE